MQVYNYNFVFTVLTAHNHAHVVTFRLSYCYWFTHYLLKKLHIDIVKRNSRDYTTRQVSLLSHTWHCKADMLQIAPLKICRLLMLTSESSSSFVLALDGRQADGLFALLFVVVSVGLQVTAAQAPLVLLLPHPPLLGLSTDRGSQTLLLFLQKQPQHNRFNSCF